MLPTFHREYVEGLTATMIEEALAAERLEERQVVQIYHWVRELALWIRSGVCSDSTAAFPGPVARGCARPRTPSR